MRERTPPPPRRSCHLLWIEIGVSPPPETARIVYVVSQPKSRTKPFIRFGSAGGGGEGPTPCPRQLQPDKFAELRVPARLNLTGPQGPVPSDLQRSLSDIGGAPPHRTPESTKKKTHNTTNNASSLCIVLFRWCWIKALKPFECIRYHLRRPPKGTRGLGFPPPLFASGAGKWRGPPFL